ncbi:hypothetical protein ABGB18_26760 [Nonomuraea sp. B12E4]|uniref:hypothetical protein n=1 Tax=Nonomuraea sp. B12E4 TaxID=3153564 RepID=UPI00325CD7C1
MIRLVTTAAALTLALSGLSPAHAALVPVYSCDTVRGDPATTVLFGNCRASLGAVTNGPFGGTAIGEARQVPLRIRCVSGGEAAVPNEVLLRDCTQIG